MIVSGGIDKHSGRSDLAQFAKCYFYGAARELFENLFLGNGKAQSRYGRRADSTVPILRNVFQDRTEGQDRQVTRRRRNCRLRSGRTRQLLLRFWRRSGGGIHSLGSGSCKEFS